MRNPNAIPSFTPVGSFFIVRASCRHNTKGSIAIPGVKGSNARCGAYARHFLVPAWALVEWFDCAPPPRRVKPQGSPRLLNIYPNPLFLIYLHQVNSTI